MKEFKQFGITLTIICLGAALLLSSVNSLTKPKIEAQKKQKELTALKEVIPQAKDFSPVKNNDEILYYRAKDSQGNTFAYAFKALGKGYSSTIITMVGINKDGKIINIKIINQNETPGLGTRIAESEQTTTIWDKLKGKKEAAAEKPWFQKQFSSKTLNDFDSIDTISGATVSSSAVKNSIKDKIKEVLKLIKANE